MKKSSFRSKKKKNQVHRRGKDFEPAEQSSMAAKKTREKFGSVAFQITESCFIEEWETSQPERRQSLLRLMSMAGSLQPLQAGGRGTGSPPSPQHEEEEHLAQRERSPPCPCGKSRGLEASALRYASLGWLHLSQDVPGARKAQLSRG